MKREKRKNDNTCLTDCVAFMFGLEPNKVPFFIGNKYWIESVQRFFKKRGYEIEPVPFKYSLLDNPRALYLVQGLSPRSKVSHNATVKKKRRGINHAVIFHGKNRLFDPANGRFIKGRPIYLWKITPDIEW